MRIFLFLFFSFCSVAVFASSGNPYVNSCRAPDNLADYKVIDDDYELIKGRRADYSPGLYVKGNVTISASWYGKRASFTGNIYATGDVTIIGSTVNGSIYAQGKITTSWFAKVTGKKCKNGEFTVIPLGLPVDELTESCGAVFTDAAQSYSSNGKLTMLENSRITDDTKNFDFDSYQTHGKSCGGNTSCRSTGKQSAKLSDFNIPNIIGASVTVRDKNIILGENDTVFGNIEVERGSLTFIEQADPVSQMYQINRLNIYTNGVVKLQAGIYAIKSLRINDASAKIKVMGEGKVYLFVEQTDAIQGSIANSSTADKLVFVINQSYAEFTNNAKVNGSIYVNGNLQLHDNAKVTGRVASANLTIKNKASIKNQIKCNISGAENYEFRINTTSDALTCEPHTVTIQVLLDGAIATDYTGTIELSTSTNLGTWSILTASDNLTDSGVNNGKASFEFSDSDAGQIELGLFNNIAGELAIVATNEVTDSNIAVVTFRPFLLKGELPAVMTANLPVQLMLTAVGQDQTTGSCQIIEEYTGNQNLKFWSTYKEPQMPIGNISVEVNQKVIAKNKSNATNQEINFNNGVATVSVNYPDAGKIQIHARDDYGIGAAPAELDELQGSFITVVKPASLFIEKITDNPAETSGYDAKTGTKFKRASVPNYLVSPIDVDTFDLTVKALIDCSDLPNKHCLGAPDIMTVAPSFTSEINLQHELIFPDSTSAASGTLHYKESLAQAQTMQEGEFTYSDLAYDEVGVVGLKVTIDDYLGTGNMASEIKPVGRFYPDYLAFVPGSFNSSPVCTENNFAYIGEPNALAVNYSMKAYSQASIGKTAKVTSNYDDDLDYPVADYFEHFAYATDGTELSGYKDYSTSNRIFSDSAYNKELWSQGLYNFDLGNIQNFYLGLKRTINLSNKVVPDGPFTNTRQVKYKVKVTGNDGEKLQVSSSELCSDDKCEIGNLTDLVYGRLRANNGHGSEFQAIRTKVEATYFDGVNFVTFPRDVCTTVVSSQVKKESIAGSKNDITSKTNLSISNSPLIAGKTYFDFSAPQEPGKLNYYIKLQTATPWLLDSGNAVNCAGADDCIKGYVEFGLFRGNDRIIYRRQSFD